MTLTIPTSTPLNTYFLLACADDVARVAESDEANNCLASPTAAVTVTRPDLVETAVSSPPATKQRGTQFPITDTVQNAGAVPSGGSVTRYYLSLDAVKSAGDLMLTGEPDGPGPRTGRQPFRNGDGDDSVEHPAQHVLPAGLCRWVERPRGDRRDQQLQGVEHLGDGHAVTARQLGRLRHQGTFTAR